MSKEKKIRRSPSLFLLVLSLAAAVFFGVMYFSQNHSFEESKKLLSSAKGEYSSLLSTISDLRLQLNAVESTNKKLKEEVSSSDKSGLGKISGLLSHKSNPLPLGLIACAETKNGDNLFCASRKDGAYYELELPAGEYYVFALETCYPPINNGRVTACPSNVAFYTEFVKCNPEEADNQCPHEKALVTVRAAEVLDRIDPSDWFMEKK